MNTYPRCSMYSLFTYIWVVLGVNVNKYIEHLGYGKCIKLSRQQELVYFILFGTIIVRGPKKCELVRKQASANDLRHLT